MSLEIETVNLHVWPKCNLHCTYCYETFTNRPRSLSLPDWCAVLDELRRCEVRRVTFSGGEPTLHPQIEEMVDYAALVGLQTSIITNGAKLNDRLIERFDLVGLSLDSADETTLTALGRRRESDGSYVAHVERIVHRVRAAGKRLKLNTVVTALNAAEDMTETILRLRPNKWKPMQFTVVQGENDRNAAMLSVDTSRFEAFLQRHVAVKAAGIWVEPESAQTVATTYVMIDPRGRVFQCGSDGYQLSSGSVLQLGLQEAMREVGNYDRAAFLRRGGAFDIRRLPLVRGGGR